MNNETHEVVLTARGFRRYGDWWQRTDSDVHGCTVQLYATHSLDEVSCRGVVVEVGTWSCTSTLDVRPQALEDAIERIIIETERMAVAAGRDRLVA